MTAQRRKISEAFKTEFSQSHIMRVLLAVACSLLLLLFVLSVPAQALQGKHLDSAISNVASPALPRHACACHVKLFNLFVGVTNRMHFFSDSLRLQLPSEKFQKSHKKFRLFDKNNDHHIGTSPFEHVVKSSK